MNNECYPYSFVVNDSLIILYCHKKKVVIPLSECARNYSVENNINSLCVATRDITNLSFVFYMNPKIKVVLKENWFRRLFTGRSAIKLFLDIQRAITELGYTSFDLT